MIGGIGQHACDHAPLLGHAHALGDAKGLDVGLGCGHSAPLAARS
jgi:hypothetical protein